MTIMQMSENKDKAPFTTQKSDSVFVFYLTILKL